MTMNEDELDWFATLNSSYQRLLERARGGGRKDIDKECDYPEVYGISPEQYREMFDKFGIAARVVSVLPDECWLIPPQVYEIEDEDTETPFEKELKGLNQKLRDDSYFVDEESSPLWEALYRADVLSGIGKFGVILLGFSDGDDMEKPLPGFDDELGVYGFTNNKKMELLYVREFDESLVDIASYEARRDKKRYGLPLAYNITMSDPTISHTGIGHESGKEVRVHWSRVIHVADNLTSSEIFGIPRQQQVYPHLLDIRKILGGSSEMFWQGGFPGISFETNPNLGSNVKIDAAAMREQVQNYFNGLQRYLALTNATAKPMSPMVSDPSNHIERNLDALCIKLGMPKRIFMGSERGELASSQDSDTWEGRLKGRRRLYLIPRLIVPFLDRLIRVGVLPVPQKGYHVKWEPKRNHTEQEKAGIAEQRMKAISTYLQSGADILMTPLDFLVKELGYDREEAEEMLESALEESEEKEEEDMEKAKKKQEAGIAPPPPPGTQPPPSSSSGNQPKPPQPKGGQNPAVPGESPKPTTNASKPSFTTNDTCGASGGKGKPGFQKGNTCAKGGVSGFPNSLSDVVTVTSLGGSTGAKLVMDAEGNKFVYKTGNSAGHIANEFAADELYRAAGVNVPEAKLYSEGGNVVKLSKYDADLKPLGSLSGDAKAKAVAKVQEDFALDAALSNWDVVGASQDNIMVDSKGEVWRVDNGGALFFRAQGAEKGLDFADNTPEIDSMRTNTKNAGAMSVFGKMSDEQVLVSMEKFNNEQAPKIQAKLSKLSSALEIDDAMEILEGQGLDDVDITSKLNKRTASVKHQAKMMKEKIATKASFGNMMEDPDTGKPYGTAKSSSPSSSGKLSDAKSLVSHLEANGSGLIMDSTLKKKIAHVNPDGVSDGVFYLPLVGSKVSSQENNTNKQELKKILPPGTKIKGFWVKGSEDKGYTIPNKELAAKVEKFKKMGGTLGPGASAMKPPTPPPAAAPKPKTSGPVSSKEGVTMVKQGKVLAHNVTEGSKFKLAPDDPKGLMNPDVLTDQKKKVKALADELTETEYSAIKSWKSEAGDFRQRISKGGTVITPKDVALKSALNKAPTYEGTVYRGVHNGLNHNYATDLGEQIMSAGVGGFWSENAPMCMTRNTSTSSGFAKNAVMMKIKTKTGAMVEQVGGYNDEMEVIGKPGVIYKIRGVHKDAEIEVSDNTKADIHGIHHEGSYKKTKTVEYFIELEEV